MARGFILKIHSITGLVAGIFIFIISITGSILVFHEELDHLSYPNAQIEPGLRYLPVDSCYGIIKKRYPASRISHCHLPEKNTDLFLFTIYDSSLGNTGEPHKLFIHPQTGRILKTASARNNFVNWIAVMHNSFHIGKPGEWLFGFFALIFLLSIITGFILFRKNILAVLTFRKRILKRSNLHQLIGVYALLFNLMISFTGFWMQRYVFKKDFYRASSYTPVFNSSPSLQFCLENSLAELKETYPAFTAYVIYFAQKPNGMTSIYGSRSTNSFIHSKKFADAIFLDSVGKVKRTAFVDEIDASDRYDIINSQVHFGQYGGITVKIIYCLFGLTGGALSITGYFLWMRRKRQSKFYHSINPDQP
jgi:uncharacterized iron-regulated membrane protein